MDKESYKRGFEDCAELCLAEISESKNVAEATTKVAEILGLIKEDKIERLKQMIWMIGR